MPRLRIYRGHRASAGAISLARRLGVPAIRRTASRFRARVNDTIINWGCTEAPAEYAAARWINHPERVDAAVCKLRSLRVLLDAGVPVPDFTEERLRAIAWSENGLTVMARTMLRASAGRGLVVCQPMAPIPAAPLYTQYFKGSHEYRVHVVRGEVIDAQEKRRREGADANTFVRNLENGWVFCRGDVQVPDVAAQAAIQAVTALGLDFGAVDLKMNKQGTRCAVLEVNTAPGLEGTTLERYAEALRRIV